MNSNKLTAAFCLALAISLLATGLLYAWGFWGHKRINRMAVFTLPSELMGFYKANIDFIEEHAVDPDKRRYASKNEAPRHYIDVDHYGDYPFDSLPMYWKDAVAKYTEDTLMAYGIVPWHVNRALGWLTDAFRKKDYERILQVSADLGHYIGDAHVPLHCTKNYNGQLTNQHGIHGFWESRIPELNGDNYDYFIGKAEVIEKPQEKIWQVVKESFAAKDSVLDFERELNKRFPSDKKYAFEQRGAQTMRVYSKEYAKEYDKMLNGMVERRMRQSIIAVGSFWVTAWYNAGQPNLKGIEKVVMSEEMKKQLEEEDKMWRTGKIENAHGHSDE
ncbi:MAG: S1/P1 Nuclease [Bacteroidetes bacterium]|nr:S1/P1 Nuclease [Bacteroidota bacterium]